MQVVVGITLPFNRIVVVERVALGWLSLVFCLHCSTFVLLCQEKPLKVATALGFWSASSRLSFQSLNRPSPDKLTHLWVLDALVVPYHVPIRKRAWSSMPIRQPFGMELISSTPQKLQENSKAAQGRALRVTLAALAVFNPYKFLRFKPQSSKSSSSSSSQSMPSKSSSSRSSLSKRATGAKPLPSQSLFRSETSLIRVPLQVGIGLFQVQPFRNLCPELMRQQLLSSRSVFSSQAQEPQRRLRLRWREQCRNLQLHQELRSGSYGQLPRRSQAA